MSTLPEVNKQHPLVGKVAERECYVNDVLSYMYFVEMSEYLKSLDPIAKKRYIERLHLLDLDESDDPYAKNEDKLEDDVTKWPPVEYGHIFCYFIERPGLYTRRQLMQWKSLDAYNYFQSGHVRPVRIWCLKHVSILMALVNPSQNSPDKAHCAWVATRKDGEIITVHCTCMAG